MSEFEYTRLEEDDVLDTPTAGHSASVGGPKTITFAGGIMLLINSITGPGILTIPLLFQEAGWLTPVICIVAVAIISYLSSVMLCSAMEKVPGNGRFKGRIEFAGVAKVFFWNWAYILTVLLLIGSMIAAFIPAVVISAQTVDGAFIAVFGQSHALRFWPLGFITAHKLPDVGSSPFGDDYVLTLGYIIVVAVTIPMGFFNLDDNIIVQKGAFVLTLAIFVQWVVTCCILGFHESVPVITSNQAPVLGSIIFNFAYVTTIPSWCNEKSPEVGVKRSIYTSVIVSSLFYIIIGMLGGYALRFGDGQDLLLALQTSTRHSKALHTISSICVYLFPIVALLSGLPVFSIIMKYNLVENNICRKSVGTFWAVIFPWVISVLLYPGQGALDVINWTSLCVNGITNFVIPMLLYIVSRHRGFTRITVNFDEDLVSEEEYRRSVERDTMNLITDDYATDARDYHFRVLPRSKLVRPTCIAISAIVVVSLMSAAVIALNIYTKVTTTT
ncbi:hypothetical protein PROFUN_07114 [Planoprotostelium fungivorum]|uniref:Amino acid transporter transmembrane domain-containing protein n=1 Tax=Planoprotostelium fungivorum TaxID=1890364 RepID=A0A2P6NMI8_9EUKA|nr:hypothetical protein PROFUN_07114 [Planoprotostelium fungivorum]